MAEAKTKKSSYGAADITVLEGLEAVRRRLIQSECRTVRHGLHTIIHTITFSNVKSERDQEGL